jgi:hypothetical protein
VTLLYEHDIGPRDDDVINTDFIAKLSADDWGLWRTVRLNVERVHEQALVRGSRRGVSRHG